MLREAMTKTNQSGVWAEGRCGRANGLAAALALVLMAAAVGAAAETIHQSGSVAGAGHGGAHGAGAHAPGYLGIGFLDLSEEQAAALHLKLGNAVEVTNVDHDGPAGKAGLQKHDVIVSLNGQMLAGADGLHRMIRESGVGTEVAMMVMRGGQHVTISAQLSTRDEVARRAMAQMEEADGATSSAGGSVEIGVAESYVETAPAASGEVVPSDTHGPGFIAQMLHMTPFTGLAMETMEPQLAGFFGAPKGIGLLVHTVMPNSPAAVAGLRAGDVVVRADSVTIRSASDWTKRLHASKGAAIELTVIRDKREMSMTITPDLKKHAEVEWPRFY
jgi:serine protease Do